MSRAVELGLMLIIAACLHLAFAAVLLRDWAPAAPSASAAERGVALASDDMSGLIASWEAPPTVAPAPEQLAARQPDDPTPPHLPDADPMAAPAMPDLSPDAPPAATSEPAPTIALPPLRPAMTQALALPTGAPEIPSALLLTQSGRPAARPERPAPRRAEPKQQRQRVTEQPAPQEQPSRRVAPAAQPGAAGGGSRRKGPPAGATDTGQLMAAWAGRLSSCLNRGARAPVSIRQRGQVVLNLTIGRDGAIRGVGVARSSGSAELDQAAVTAARRVGRCPAAPKGLTEASYPFQLPINLR